MTTVSAGATGTYTFSATGTVDIALTAGDSAGVTITRGSSISGQTLTSSRNIGPFLSGDVMTITARRGAVTYTINAYTAAQAANDVGFANPMTAAGDMIGGGASGVAARLANPGAGTFFLKSIDGVLTWV